MPIMYSSEDSMIAKPLPMNLFRTHQKEPTLPAGQANELDLVRRIAGKDECALQQLYAIHGRGLYAYALHLAGDAAQAEDVVQAVLVPVWQTSGRYRGEGRSIREGWRKLTAEHRTVLKLVFYLGLGLEETAEVSGCPMEIAPGDCMACVDTDLPRRGEIPHCKDSAAGFGGRVCVADEINQARRKEPGLMSKSGKIRSNVNQLWAGSKPAHN